MDYKKNNQELIMFGKILKAMAGGLALRKLFDGWLLQNEAKESKKNFKNLQIG